MGNATTICSDKTGTLTKNRMTVVRAYAGKTDFEDPKKAKSLPTALVEAISVGFCVNSDSKSTYVYNESGMLEQQGNKTECACLLFSDTISTKSHNQLRQEHPETSFIKVRRSIHVDLLAFCLSNKMFNSMLHTLRMPGHAAF
jgi:P-type Ca2+ transporter type 2B